MVEMMDGQHIQSIHTRKSMYDAGCVKVIINKEEYLMPCSTILQMVNEFVFDIEQKKKYKHIVGVNWFATAERNGCTNR